MSKPIRTLITKTAESLGYYIGILPPTAETAETHACMLCEKENVNCLIDVGSHHGEYALRMRKAGYKGRIVSYEPVTENYAVLKEKSADDNNWFIHHAGMADISGTMTMNVTVGTEAASLLTPSEYGKRTLGKKLSIKKTEEVQVKTISEVYDACVAGLNNPKVYLKVDAQGYDMKVFEGAKGKLPLLAGLQTEMSVQQIYNDSPDYRTCIEILTNQGFSLSGIFPVRVDRSMKLIEMDCIMVRDA